MAKKPIARRLAAVFSADVAGYTRLMGADEAGTLARLDQMREQLLEPIISAHHGRVVKLMGDGLLIEFGSAVDAVDCAIAWQRAVADHEVGSGDRAMCFRIGINVGDIMVEKDDIYGDGVNVAARLQTEAEPGGICISADTYHQVHGKIDAAFDDLGERHLKHVAELVRVYRVGGTPTTPLAPRTESARALHKPSIAVLPFVNMSNDPDQDYFSDGITEDIITELSRFRSLYVVARNSSFALKGRSLRIEDAGRELSVRFAVEGSVRKAGNRVRITAQLVDTVDGNHLWADRYDRDLDDIFAVQDDVVQRTVTALARRVEDVARHRIARKPPENMDAYDYNLRAYPFVLRASRPDDTKRARELLDKALAADAAYARPHALLAMSHVIDVVMFWTDHPAASLSEAFQSAQRAVVLDNADNLPHWVLGTVLLYERRFGKAIAHIERSLTLNPNDADLRAICCLIYTCLGDPEKGVAFGESAMERNPFYPDWYPWMLAFGYYQIEAFEKAINVLDTSRSLNLNMRRIRAMALAQLGRADEAKKEVDRVLEERPD
ncbi:MAG: adenylate/guanylate cyclase domain-containing protein, partial [Pseudomonadota bacterium]